MRFAHADDAAMAEAQARFNEGLELADKAKFDEARLKFLQAFVVLKAPPVLFNLASTEQKTGHDVEAIEHYRAFLKTSEHDTRITDAMREKAKENIAKLLTKVGLVEIDAPDGAKISIDGKPLEERPNEPVPVTPGKHTIEATLNGKVESVTLAPRYGELVRAKFSLDGPPDAPNVAPADEEDERATAGWLVPITLGVLGAGGVVMGAAFASASQSSKDDSEALRRASPGLCTPPGGPACHEYDAKRSDAESQATISYVGYVAGGALLAGAIASFVFWPKSGKSTSPARGMIVTPHVGPQAAGGSVELRF